MGGVFLSYAHKDRPVAAALAKEISAQGVEVWWDDHLSHGEAFRSEIGESLAAADLVLVLWTEAAGQSAWVAAEALEARNTGRLLSISVDGAFPPIGFRQFQFLALDTNNPEAFRDLGSVAAKTVRARAEGGAPQRQHRGFIAIDFSGRYGLPLWKLVAGSFATAVGFWAVSLLSPVYQEVAVSPTLHAFQAAASFAGLLVGRAVLPDPQGVHRSRPQPFFSRTAIAAWLATYLVFIALSFLGGILMNAVSVAGLPESVLRSGLCILPDACSTFVLPAMLLRIAHALGWFAPQSRVIRINASTGPRT